MFRIKISTEQLLRSIKFLERATFWEKLIFRRSNIPHYLPFQENVLSIAATFPEELLFHSMLFQKRYNFIATLPFHSCTFCLSVSNQVSSIPVRYSKSVRVFSCAFIIAQSRIIDKVY